ncbi:unnamed protein product [Lathyrus sativus]|nr:unnamed protein product [Lathyrus sativus]
MAVSSLLPTTSPLSLSLPPSSSSTRRDNNNNIHRVSFLPIAYPKLSHSISTTLFFAKSRPHNVEIVVDEDDPGDEFITRFRREVFRVGVFQECRRRRFFETPIDKIKRKRRQAAMRKRRWRNVRTRITDESDSSNQEKVDDDDEEDNWDLSDVDFPFI